MAADKAGDALLLLLFLLLLFLLLLSLPLYFPFHLFICPSHTTLVVLCTSYKKKKDDSHISRPADRSGPVRDRFWGMALVLHLMTWSIAPGWVNSLRLPIQNVDIALRPIHPTVLKVLTPALCLCLLRCMSCFPRPTMALRRTTTATAALAPPTVACSHEVVVPSLFKAQPSRTSGGMNSLSDLEKAKT